MNIKIVDSWLREYLKTSAKPSDISRELSLRSISVDRTEKIGNDFVYDIEVTTNRPDLMSTRAVAMETAAVLSEENIEAKFIDKKYPDVPIANISFPIEIVDDPDLTNRIMAVVMEVKIGESPKEISNRLEHSGIRSLNNLIDVTNYVMREIGHPAHVFDYDLLNTKKMVIRKSKAGEKLTTLDGKTHVLTGGDIVALNDKNEIIDLLGIMGTKNSVVQENTKRIMFFLDNLNPRLIRKTSMNLGIRTEAAIINEKGIDPELMDIAFKRGVELYRQVANAKVVSKVIDIYPNKSKTHEIKVMLENINSLIGVEIPVGTSISILEKLGFKVEKNNESLIVKIPTIRADEVKIAEDVIEEIARIYGYHKLPSKLPTFNNLKNYNFANEFYFENRIKEAFKYWGYTEIYTYSMVSEEMYDGNISSAFKIKNPLTTDMEYLRNSLVPSLLKVIDENKSKEVIKIFEISNVYIKNSNEELPDEKLILAGALKQKNASFFEVKGLIEQLFIDLGIKNLIFKDREEGGANIFIEKEKLGYIEILNNSLIDFELSFELILKFANLKKIYKPLAKFPAIYEDITLVLPENVSTQSVLEEIKLQSFLIREVTLKDQFQNAKTFHISYQSDDKNLSNSDIEEIRESIIKAVKLKFKASVK